MSLPGRTALLILAALLLTGCARVLDAEQARICRIVIPALNPQGARIDIVRTVPGPGRSDITIDYRAEGDGLPRRNRFTVCRFAAEDITTQRADLRGVATERGPLGDAAFYFLKRFYLSDPTAAAADPRPEVASSGLEVPFAVAYALQHAISGLPSVTIYGLVAAAYALIFGLVGRVMLGFGEFAALGGAATLLSATFAAGVLDVRGALAVAAVAGAVAAGWHGIVAGRLAIGRLSRASGQQVVIATVGLSLALSEYLRLTQGAVTPWIAPVWNDPITVAGSPGFTAMATPIGLLVSAAGFAAAAALIVFMRRSAFGRRWRAYADDRLAAALFGIDERRLLDTTFALACALSGLAGALTAILYGAVGFAGGFGIGMKALIAAVVGGIGSVGGAFLGGLLVAGVETVWSATMPIEHRDIALYALLVAFLIWRPSGLLGSPGASR